MLEGLPEAIACSAMTDAEPTKSAFAMPSSLSRGTARAAHSSPSPFTSLWHAAVSASCEPAKPIARANVYSGDRYRAPPEERERVAALEHYDVALYDDLIARSRAETT